MSHFNALIQHAARHSIPLDVALEITHHCNYRCQHCYIPDFSAPNAMSTERIMVLLEELRAMGTLFLTLTGGEMFLRKDWFDIARRARSLGFALRLFTNASRITSQIAHQVSQLGSIVEITVFSMNEAVFDEITQRKGSFRATMAGIAELHKQEVQMLIKTPLMTLNNKHDESVREYALGLGAAFQSFTSIAAKKDGDRSTLALRLDATSMQHYLNGPFSGCHVARSIQEDEPLCAAASRFCNITAAGDVMACNILPGSGGNLLNQSFQQIWQHSPWLNEVRSIRRRDLDTCNTCDRLAYCGRCHAQALVEDGNMYGPSTAAQSRADLLDQMGVSFAV